MTSSRRRCEAGVAQQTTCTVSTAGHHAACGMFGRRPVFDAVCGCCTTGDVRQGQTALTFLHLQATVISKLRSEVSRARADLKVAESRLALLQQSAMPRDDVREAVSRLAGKKVRVRVRVSRWRSLMAPP